MGKQVSGGSFSGWNGKDDHLPVGLSVSGTYKWRSVIYFPISWTGITGVTSASLKLYSAVSGTVHSNQTSSPSTLNIERMTSDWGEGSTDPGEGGLTGSLSWDWDNRYDKYTTSGDVSASLNQTGDSNDDVHTYDVTDIVTAWFDGSNNYGMMLRNSNETSSTKGLQFGSREHSSITPPTLIINYTTNTAPNAPTGLSPSASVTNTSPSFSANGDDDDSGDFVSAFQVNVYAPTALYRWSTSTANSDPGSGYIRAASGYTDFYVSETDKNGGSVSAAFGYIPTTAFIVARADPSRFIKGVTYTGHFDNGAWQTLNFTSSATSGVLVANEDVYLIMDTLGSLNWDSGGVTTTGSPSSFSIPYGSSGTSSPVSGNVCYIWRAKTRDKGSEWGPYSALVTFKCNTTPSAPTVTINASPTTDILDNTPSFSATHNDSDVDDQKMYYHQAVIEVYSGGAWSTYWDSGAVSHVSTPVTTTTFDSIALTFGGRFRIKVRTQDSSGTWSPYSSLQEFYIHKATVTSLSPTGGTGTSLSPTFTGSAGSSNDVITAYTIAVYTADLVTTMLAPTRYTTGIIGGGTGFSKAYAGSTLTANVSYVWNVTIETSNGDTAVSSNQAFIVQDATVPTVTAPVGDNAYSTTPTITGSRATVFNRFKYEIYPSTSTDSSLGTVIYASASLSATITGAGPTTFSVAYGGSPALSYGTAYKIRAAVSSDAGSTWSAWSGLVSWNTDAAALGTPNSPIDGDWITSLTPAFYIDRGGSDTIDQMQVRVWNSAGTTMIWDSGMTDVSNGTTHVGPVTYAGTALVGGNSYKFDFRYQKTGGAIGGYSTKYSFRINGAPQTPSGLEPVPGFTFADTLFPTFKSIFSDPEQSSNSDYPTKWSIRILDGSMNILTTKDITSGLNAGQNQYIWQSGDYALGYSTDYIWQNWYTDSKLAVGAYSAQSVFRMGVSPNGTITTPTNASTVSTVQPQIDWSYSGGTQAKYRVQAFKTDAFGNGATLVHDSGYKNGTATTYTIPSGQLKDKNYYNITLNVTSTDNLQDPSPSTVSIQVVQDAPDPIDGVSVTTFPETSKVEINWTAPSSLKSGHTFQFYQIERRLINDENFIVIGTKPYRTSEGFTDYYAGHDIDYEYRVTIHTSKTGSDDLESPDGDSNRDTGRIAADVWMFVGYDRSESHIQELFVTDESHTRPVQQESFETLGSNRKTIIRGFVLGNEGTISMMYRGNTLVASPDDEQVFYEETVLGRRLIDYLTFNAGPHILKSPFGDVWDVEFASPEYKWIKGGHLQVDLSWVETGQTSQNGSI